MKKNKITQINCHAEFSSASHGILKQVQDDRNNESGRSMVEMLGVLAIIGVLSVGGIAGYTTAMRSHRANEIVNACSLLYVVANTKNESDDVTYESAFGSLPTGISELKYNKGTITAKITDAAVCTEVKNKLGDKISGECSALTVTLGEVKNTRNCWLTNDCTADDIEEGEAWCNGGLHLSEFCEEHAGDFSWGGGTYDAVDVGYSNCLKSGKERSLCYCATRIPDATFELSMDYCVCKEQGDKSDLCCSCQFLGGLTEQQCRDESQCP